MPCFPDDHAGLGTFQANKSVAVAVLSFAGLEESAEHLALVLVVHGEKGFREVLGGICHVSERRLSYGELQVEVATEPCVAFGALALVHQYDFIAYDFFRRRSFVEAHEYAAYGFVCHGADIGCLEQREPVAVADVVECAFGVFGDDDSKASARA